MSINIEYSPRERFWLWAVAILGVTLVNSAFIYGLLAQPAAMMAAITNPISLAFMIEAMLMLGLLAYLLTKWGVSKFSAGAFVLLSLLGSMAFALPTVLLWKRRAE